MAMVVLAWGGYPLILRASGVSGPIGALVLTLSALLPIGAALLWTGGVAKPSNPDLWRLVISGVVMGVGTTAFNFVINSRRVEASVSVPIMDVGMLLVTAVGAVWLYAEPLTLRKTIGIGLLLVGIAVLRPG